MTLQPRLAWYRGLECKDEYWEEVVKATFELPGKEMLALQSLRIDKMHKLFSPKTIASLCQQFRDPLFCPNLTRLPEFIIPESALDYFQDEHIDQIKIGLEGLRARGLTLPAGEIEKTVWALLCREQGGR